jgi:putative DNA primase/helicase
MEGFAKAFIDMGFVPMGIYLWWDKQANRKKQRFKPMWNRVTFGTYRDYFQTDDNGIALITGEPSDLIVIDCDVLKESDKSSGVGDGLAAFQALVREHGLPDHTPEQRTPSGGAHYFFSLSKSMERGLNLTTNSAKIMINGAPVSIDTRADGGCIFVDPSCIGKKKYKFINPLVAREKLPAMPDWCIKLLNNGQPLSKKEKPHLSSLRNEMDRLSLDTNFRPLDEHRAVVFIKDVSPHIETILQIKISRKWIRSNGFDFPPCSKVECMICGVIHESNNYHARPILEDSFSLGSYSTKCSTRAFNWENHEIFKIILRTPTVDRPYSMMLYAALRSRGYQLVHAYDKTKEAGRFMCFNGYVWEEVGIHRVRNDIADTCSMILDTLLRYVHPQHGTDEDQVKLIKFQRKQLAKGRAFLDKSTNLNNILSYYKTLYTNEALESSLDTDPNIIVVKNGVVELQTGKLRRGMPSDYMSRQLNVNFKGIDSETDIIDGFIGDLFNHNQDAIKYLQRLLGYGITGRTDSQVWAMFTGEGSNGKSLLARLLKSLLEGWLVTAPHEIFFKGRRANDGAHTTHLAPLKGKRICIKEEAEPTEQLNTEILKMLTGGGEIIMRSAYAKEYVEFEPMVLPILLCNHRPAVDVNDHAMMRRIVVVPFHNIYTSPGDPKRPYNPDNTRHRIRDPELGKKLLQEEAREQLLVWLIRGAMAWYQNTDLSDQPDLMLQAFEVYNEENDAVKQFIDMYCQQGKSYQVNCVEFRDRLCKTTGTTIQANKLADLMANKGFILSSTRDKVRGQKIRVYNGLCFLVETNYEQDL